MAASFPTREEFLQALSERHGAALQQRFSAARVAVCGLGGLGSNLAVSLARAGIGRLHLIDFDRVDLSNLQRQQYALRQIGMLKTDALKQNLNAISPYIAVQADTVRITEENFGSLLREDDIICEAFDHAQAKAMLVNGILEQFPDKYVIAASGMAGLESGNRIRTRKVTSRFYLCGDECSDVADSVGLLSSRVMLCAAHQAHTVLRILAGGCGI